MIDTENTLESTKHVPADNAYISISYWMARKLGLKGTELMIYGLIHGFSQDGESLCYSTIDYMMEMTGLTKNTVLKNLQKLEEKKLIVKTNVTQYIKQTSNGISLVKAKGSQHFCTYYTVESRRKKELEENTTIKQNIPNNMYSNNSVSLGNCSGAEFVPDERKESSGAEFALVTGAKIAPATGAEFAPYNNTNNNINTTTSKIKIENEDLEHQDKKTKEEVVVFNKNINKLFGYDVNFNPNPYPELKERMTNIGIPLEQMSTYLSWIYEYLKPKCQNMNNFVGYFFKSFTQPSVLQEFNIIHNKKNTVEEHDFVCPVCGCVHRRGDIACPECDFSYTDLNNEEEIAKAKIIFNMPNKIKNNYENDLAMLIVQYPLSQRLHNKDIQKQYELKAAELDNKYFS